MNVRNKRKATKKAMKRMEYFKPLMFYHGRRNGRTYTMNIIENVCFSKKYKSLKEFKRHLKLDSEGD